MKGFVYLICDPSQEAYKIGVTRNLAQQRLKKLQTGNASEMHIVDSIETDYPFRLESMLHNKFKSKKALNEWFYLEPDDVINFKDICQKQLDIIEVMKDNPFFLKELK